MPKRKKTVIQEPAPPQENSATMLPGLHWIALAFALAYPAIVRLRMLALPLERDEGEYAYAGQLLLQGIPPYELVYNMKFPGTYAAYAAILGILGESVTAIRLGILLVTTITAVLLYLLGERWFGKTAGVITAAVYALLAVAPQALGVWGHATHFINLFVAAALLLLVPEKPRHLFGAGALLGVAVLMKQPAIFFAAFAFVYIAVVSTRRLRDLAALAAGGATVAILTLIALSSAGVLDRFLFWTVTYAREYASITPLEQGLEHFRMTFFPLLGYAPLLWLAALAGLILIFARGSRNERLFASGFLLAGILAVIPGLYFREHYYIVLFPALAFLAGRLARYAIPVAIAVLITIVMSVPRLVATDPDTFAKEIFGGNPFPQSREVATFLSEHTGPDDRIVVLGSEPQIYFYANRKSATGYIYAYPLMEEQPFAAQMQQEMIRQIEAAKPKYLVFVSTDASWLRKPKSDLALFTWYQQQVTSGRWIIDGAADITDAGTQFVWGEAARAYSPRGNNVIVIYRRAA